MLHKNPIRFSIIVALYNQCEYTQLFLQSIRENSTQKYELIVVDNGSSDQTKNLLRHQKIDKFVAWDENKGTTKAWNEGIRHARGEFLCIINNDILVAPHWMEGLLETLENAPTDLATLSPSTNDVTYQLQIPFGPQAPFLFYEEAKQMQTKQKILFPYSLIGSSIIIPRNTIEKIGIFDERFVTYYNDLDYNLSLTAMGMKAYTTSKSIVYHFGGASAKGINSISKQKELDKIKFLEKWNQTRNFLNQYFTILS